MLDDVREANHPIEDYLVGLRLLEGVADDVDVVVPGHGSGRRRSGAHLRIELDRAYVHALRDGDDPRRPPGLGASAKPGWEWVSDVHDGQARSLARRNERDGMVRGR